MMCTTEETLRLEFSRFKPGSVERVKKLTDYAFIHYRCRDDAVTALNLMNGAQIDGVTVEVTLAKPAGIKDGSVAGRRYNNRGYLANAAGGGNGTFALHRNDGGMMAGPVDAFSPLRTVSLPPRLGSPFYPGAPGGEEDVLLVKSCLKLFFMFSFTNPFPERLRLFLKFCKNYYLYYLHLNFYLAKAQRKD